MIIAVGRIANRQLGNNFRVVRSSCCGAYVGRADVACAAALLEYKRSVVHDGRFGLGWSGKVCTYAGGVCAIALVSVGAFTNYTTVDISVICLLDGGSVEGEGYWRALG